ncbi:pyocin knob domain-containing S74 family peptidase [Escherichia coli]
MADIITGKGLTLQYNTDTGNRSPQGVGNITVNEVNTFPILTIHSETNTFDTYDSEYNSVLLSDKTVEPFQIVVNYLPDDSTHMFLDEMAESQEIFQCIIQYELNSDDSTITYAIVNGYITSTELSGDKDTVVSKSYTFTPEDVIARMSTSQAFLPLLQGDYGVGSNGVDIPQYEPDVPEGNGFIKVPSSQPGNPAGSDMLGIGLVDGASVAEFAITKTGTLSLFAKNGSTAWTRIYTATQMDARYVPLTRTINGHDLSTNVTVTKSDVGLGTVIDAPQLTVANNLSDLANKTTARSNLGVYSTGQVDTRIDNLNTALSADISDLNTDITNLNTSLSADISDVNTRVDNLSTDVSTNYVPKTTTVNGHALTGNVTVSKADVGLGNVTNDVQLKKASNLSDVADMNATRSNLGINTIDRDTVGGYSFLYSPSFGYRLIVGNNGDWSMQNATNGTRVALGINSGGTGATNSTEARTNLELFRDRRTPLPVGQNLNDYTGTYAGVYNQNLNANIQDGMNYPEKVAGSLLVLSTGAGESCTQIYTVFNVNKAYRRAYNSENSTWSNWSSFVMSADVIPVSQGGTGATTVAGARSALDVNSIRTNGGYTIVNSPSSVTNLVLGNDGSVVFQNQNGSTLAFPVSSGGTGATTASAALANLGGFPTTGGTISGNVGVTGNLTSNNFTSNTSTSVNNLTSWPGAGNTILGGYLRSQITVNGEERASTNLRVIKSTDSSTTISRLSVYQVAAGSVTSQTSVFDFSSEGNIYTNGRLSLGNPRPNEWWASVQQDWSGIRLADSYDTPGNNAISAITWGYQHSNGYNLRTLLGNVGNGTNNWAHTALTQFGDAGGAGVRYWYFVPTTGDLLCNGGGAFGGSYTFQKAATSDANLKHDIEYNDGLESYENIKKFKPCTFIYNFDESERVRRGVIAQDVMTIDDEYTKFIPDAPTFDEDGNRIESDGGTYALDNNVIMMDTALALRYSIEKIEKQESTIDDLQSQINELKSLVQSLLDNK